MKILQTLVSYLAVTGTALSFCPFAFASPLANDYDGYVNITQNPIDGALMKHILSSTVEICQAVTTQNLSASDNALMKRVPGDGIEARQAAVVVPAVILIVFIVVGVFGSIIWIAEDDRVRGSVVKFLVEHFY